MRNRSVTQRGDRGATLIVVAAFSIIAVMMMAFVVDIGGLRAEKKEVTLSTDAAALAAASVIDFSDLQATGSNVDCGVVDSTDKTFGPTVEHVALHYLAENGDSVLGDCRIFFGGKSDAYVTVTASDDVDYRFGQTVGASAGTAFGTSSARVASPAAGNLYPVGMCSAGAVDALNGETSKVFDPPIAENPNFENAACGGAGNKRQVQFDPSLNGNSCGGPPQGMWCYDFNNGGFDGAPKIVESDPGKDWQKAAAVINDFIADGTHIWVPAIKYLSGSGTNATYEVTHFLEVSITSYSKKAGLGLLVHQIAPYDPIGPPASTVAPRVESHLCATGPDTTACTNNPSQSAGGPVSGPPSGADCTVSSSTPKSQDVASTSGGTSTVDANVTVVVADAADCESTLGIAAIDGTTAVFGQQVSRTGNTYQLRFPSGTAFGAIKTFPIQLYSGGLIDETMQLTTVVGSPPVCAVTAVNPTQLTNVKVKRGKIDDSKKVEFNIAVQSSSACPGLKVELVHSSGTPVNEVAMQAPVSNVYKSPDLNGSVGYVSGASYTLRVTSGSYVYTATNYLRTN